MDYWFALIGLVATTPAVWVAALVLAVFAIAGRAMRVRR